MTTQEFKDECLRLAALHHMPEVVASHEDNDNGTMVQLWINDPVYARYLIRFLQALSEPHMLKHALLPAVYSLEDQVVVEVWVP